MGSKRISAEYGRTGNISQLVTETALLSTSTTGLLRVWNRKNHTNATRKNKLKSSGNDVNETMKHRATCRMLSLLWQI